MGHAIIAIVLAFAVFSVGVVAGREWGWQQYHDGEVVCQENLTGALDCVPKKWVKRARSSGGTP